MQATLLLSVLLAATVAASAAPWTYDRVLRERPLLFVDEINVYADEQRETVLGRLRGLFQSMDNGLDINGDPTGGAGDSKLDKGEISYRIISAQQQHLATHALSLLLLGDKDRDGLLTETEALAVHPGSSALFHAADLNSDGWLSEAEILRYVHPEAVHGMHRYLALEMVSARDGNGDAALSLAELADHLSEQERTRLGVEGPGTVVSKELFGQIDANKDGKVNAEELARHFRRAYEAAVEGKAARILSLADANNNGAIELAELESSFLAIVSKPEIIRAAYIDDTRLGVQNVADKEEEEVKVEGDAMAVEDDFGNQAGSAEAHPLPTQPPPSSSKEEGAQAASSSEHERGGEREEL